MVRTQIQLEKEQWEQLRRQAFEEKRSLSELIREMVRERIGNSVYHKRYGVDDFSFVGSGKSGKRNRVSEEHDSAFSHALKL